MSFLPLKSLDILPWDLVSPILAQGAGESIAPMLPLMMLLGGLFYFMILRPESRKRAEQERMHKELKKNDRVLTIGGIYGTIVNVQQGQDELTIKVDENNNTRLRITRNSIQSILNKEKDSEKSAAK